MADTTYTESLQSLSFVSIGYRKERTEAIQNNSFLKCGGEQKSKFQSRVNIIDGYKSTALNLFYIPDHEKIFTYNWLKVDKTVLDITIFNLDITMAQSILDQIDDTNVNINVMWLNRYEFIILFNIDCDYISDVQLSTDQKTDNQFIKDYLIKKIVLTPTSIAFKFYQNFKV